MSLVTLVDPQGTASEAYRTLRTNLLLATNTAGAPLRAFVVSSPDSQTESSRLCANLAVSFAQAGQRVVVIDANLRKPSLHLLFDHNEVYGLSDYLMANPEVNHPVLTAGPLENSYLQIVFSGQKVDNPADLISYAGMGELLVMLRESADLVIVLAAPLDVGSDAILLGAMTDGVLLTSQKGRTRRTAVRRSIDQLSQADVHVLGTALIDS